MVICVPIALAHISCLISIYLKQYISCVKILGMEMGQINDSIGQKSKFAHTDIKVHS